MPTLPPSARDFQIYQRLMLDGASTRQVASDCSLSQTRVRQIASRVAHWMAESLPHSSEAMDASYLRLAQHIAADRLQFLYGQAMHGWRATNQAKYAGVILRVTAALGKMSAMPGTLDALLADALEGPLPENVVPSLCEGHEAEPTFHSDSSSPPSTSPSPTPHSVIRTPHSSPPPSRDCSPVPNSPPTSAKTLTPSAALTHSLQTPSGDLPPTKSAARRAFLAPAHPSGGTGILPVSAASDEPPNCTTEFKITPQTLGFTTKKTLSRRDRRRLRRLAAK